MDPPVISTELLTPQQLKPPEPKTTLTELVKQAWSARCAALGLSDKEKREFEAHACNGLQDYLEKIKESCEKNRDESYVFKTIDWFEPIFKLVELFTPAATAITQAYPNPGSLVLGGVLFVLSITSRLARYQKLTLQMLDRMGRKASIILEYEKDLYRDEAQIQKALVEVYVDILAFCHQAFRILPDPGQVRAKVKGLKLIWFRDYESYLEKEVTNFEQHLEDLRHVVSISDSKRLKELYDSRAADQESVGQALAEQQSHFKRQDEVYVDLWKAQLELRHHTEREERRKTKATMLQWLSPLGFHRVFHEKCDDHLPNTGQWLLDSSEYQDWKRGTDSDLIWVTGKPGCGKSVLAALTVTDITLEKGPGVGFAYAFCQKEYESSQSLEYMLGALAKQVNLQQSELDPVLESEFSAYHQNEKPSKKTVMAVMKSVLQRCTKAFLLVDALDECKESRSLAEELINLVQEEALPCVKVIVFSRHDFLEETFRDHNQLHPDRGDNEEDLKAYIDSEFPNSSQNDDDKKIRELCINKAQGMFLWVKLLAQNLNKPGLTSRMKLKKIEHIPPGLAGIYDRILEDICKQDEALKSVAFLVLLWVTHAQAPLSQSEMLEAVADYDGVSRLEKASRQRSPGELVSVCKSLVFIDGEENFRLCHDSVRDYLDTRDPNIIQPLTEYQLQNLTGHERLAEICLQYLLLDNFACGPAKTLGRFHRMLTRSPFLLHAAGSWAHHAAHHLTPHLQELILRLAASQPRRELCMQILLFPITADAHFWDHDGTTNALHFLSLFGFKQLAEALQDTVMLLEQPDGSGATALLYALRGRHHEMSLWLIDIAKQSSQTMLDASQRVPAIHYAARSGWVDVLRRLIHEDVSCINSRHGRYDLTPLLCACMAGERETAAFLIENDADVNMCDGDGDSPLIVSTVNERADIVSLLLEHDSNPNCRTAGGSTPLHFAAQLADATISVALLESKADPLAKSLSADDQTPLHMAAEYQSLEVIKQLYRFNSELNMKTKQGWTALHIAAWCNSAKSAELLIKLGIAKEEVDDRGRSALFIAALKGHLDTVKVLVRNGCNVKLQNENGRTAVHAAAISGKLLVLQSILESQPLETWRELVNERSKQDETVLHEAMVEGKLAMVKRLLAIGADPAAKSLFGSVPLHFAADYGHRTLPRALLEHSKEPNPRDRNGDTPLHLAARNGRYDFIVQFFQDCTAMGLSIDIDAQNKWKSTALHSALVQKCKRVAAFLLRKKASSKPNDDGNYPIHLAAWNGYDTIVESLLSHDGVTSKGYCGRTPLWNAAFQGHLTTLKLLVEHCFGDDEVLNYPNDKHNPPVMAALLGRHVEVANYLLDNQAEHTAIDEDGDTLLHVAAEIGDLPMVQRLLKLGCRGNVQNRYGQTAFSNAIQANSVEIIRELIDAGFNATNIRGYLNKSCAMIAAEEGNLEMLKMLEQHEASYGKIDLRGRHAAYYAASEGQVEVMQYLKEHGEDFSLRDHEGNSLLMAAADDGHLKMVQYLLEHDASVVNEWNDSRSTALIMAAARGYPLTVEYLLKHGADPNHRDIAGLCALDYASQHHPSLRKMHKAQYFYNADTRQLQEHIIVDTIQRCCRELLAQGPLDAPSEELYHRAERIEDLMRALFNAKDSEAFKVCFMERRWSPKFAILSASYFCDICGTTNFTGDRYVCKSCYRTSDLCEKCHEDYIDAGAETPEALKEVSMLEQQIQPLRAATAEFPSLFVVSQTVHYFGAGAQWMSATLESYKEWERKYKSAKRYNTLDRPGHEFIKMVDAMWQLVVKGYDDGDVDAEDIKKLFKLEKEYEIHCRRHRADQEVMEFICKNHEFLKVSEEDREKAKSEGKDLDSSTGRVTKSFLQGLLDRYSRPPKFHANQPDQNRHDWITEASEARARRAPRDEEEMTLPLSLKRSFTLTEKIPRRFTTIDEQTLSWPAPQVILPTLAAGDAKVAPPQRAQTLPIRPIKPNELDSKSIKIEMQATKPFAAVQARLQHAGQVPEPASPQPTLEKTVSVSFVDQSQVDSGCVLVSTSDPTGSVASPSDPLDANMLSLTLSEEPESIAPTESRSRTDATAPSGSAESGRQSVANNAGEDSEETEQVMDRSIRNMYLRIHDYEEDDEDMKMWVLALNVTNAMIPGFSTQYFQEKLDEMEEREQSAEEKEEEQEDEQEDGEDGDEDDGDGVEDEDEDEKQDAD